MTNDFDIFASPTMEVHTSELTASCMKAVELRLNGKVHAEAGEALFKGVVGHEALRRLHLGLEVGDLAEWAIAQQKKEGTPCSESVKTNASEYEAEALRVCMLYWTRFGSKLKTLGCELPVRGTIEIDGEDVNFASHIDILARTPEGELMVYDWKFREDAATRDYMHRNLQTAMYWWVLRNGQVQIGGQWFAFREAVDVAIIDMWNFKPYAKATSGVDDNGEPRAFVKGDDRPLHKIIRRGHYKDEAAILNEFATRVRMMRRGLWPTNPDPLGCTICQSRMYCPAFGWEDDHDI